MKIKILGSPTDFRGTFTDFEPYGNRGFGRYGSDRLTLAISCDQKQ